jgi:ribosome-binding ATPase YchF (GTP1/OBG family)
MKLSVFGIPEIKIGKNNVKDAHLDEADAFVKAKKKTYVQVECVDGKVAPEADAIIVLKDNRTDLILSDLEFVETRLSRTADEKEKALLLKIKAALEKEQCVTSLGLSAEEIASMASYTMLTNKPVVEVAPAELEDINAVLLRAVKESSYISFLTVGEKESRAWLIKKGATAWEAAGAIHSDIQKGFIRAEIIAFDDFIKAGGESAAKQAGKMRLEAKEYVMQEYDLTMFRFNKS